MNTFAAQPPHTVVAPASADRPPSDPAATPHSHGSGWSRRVRTLGRDARLVVPGLAVSVAAVIILIPLFALALGTAVIWVGVLLLPVVLVVASSFADLSRARVRQWGAPLAAVPHRPRGHGLRGWLSIIGDGRRWLDLLFESLFALPVRIVTFSVAVSWFFGGLGGLTYFWWGRFLPDDGSGLIDLIVAGWNRSPVVDLGFTAEATFQFAAGLVLLLTFPFVLHAMALLEVAAVTAGLNPVVTAPTPASRPGTAAWGTSTPASSSSGVLSTPTASTVSHATDTMVVDTAQTVSR
ncbi:MULTISPECIES: sensor domain-containing protein [unclassified Brevibacterium]|uniref:sensor domain-containing protein n=1 Tax=unclassified Brevibacterium TaxID=2614124 RepID=UPI0010F6A56C|nr:MULTISPECIES: sensor domain-containing protein [unclassified Brevibacterium]MCM1011186.1 sensor domain-containing protein [Brevibacterium sp. XM4083]